MATTAITPLQLVLNTASVTKADSTGVVATAPAEGWVIAAANLPGSQLLLKFLADVTGDTVYINAGDNPPAHRKGLGPISVVLAANEVKFIAVEASRALQDDGTITAYCADAGTMCWGFIMPKGA